MITKTAQVAKQVIGLTNRGWKVFNDKMKHGRRSLKVWGWTADDYQLAKELLVKQNCQVELVTFESCHLCRRSNTFTQLRLHVEE